MNSIFIKIQNNLILNICVDVLDQQLKENNKNKEDKKIQKNRFFKLNVLKFGNFNLNEKKIIEEKKRIDNKNNKNTKIKIVSKSLPYKKDKNKILKLYDFTNSDYIKIIEKNKIKRVNTVKKYHLSKKY